MSCAEDELEIVTRLTGIESVGYKCITLKVTRLGLLGFHLSFSKEGGKLGVAEEGWGGNLCDYMQGKMTAQLCFNPIQVGL